MQAPGMTKTFFSIEQSCSLADIKPGAHIHVIGVCGVAMAQLAILLSREGFKVSGSDKEFYDPMKSLLEESSVDIIRGYSSDNISSDLDAVVIGNVVSYGHVEVMEVERLKIPYTFFPKLLHEFLIQGKRSFVVSGTHGKSTTSAMLSSILKKNKLDPSYYIGGVANDLPESLYKGSGADTIVEGDEYDSAFFAKLPKFYFYKPDVWIITSIEFDHSDIYKSLDDIVEQFEAVLKTLKPAALVICCADCNTISKNLPTWRRISQATFITYGKHEESDYRINSIALEGGKQTVEVVKRGEASLDFSLPVSGAHNAQNALAAFIASSAAGLSDADVASSLSLFKGVKRRQEYIKNSAEYTLIEDFAHHPTAISETVKSVKNLFPDRRVWAIFEPRSNTSRKLFFRDRYIEAFARADLVILSKVAKREGESGDDLLSVEELCAEMTDRGVPSVALPDAKGIADYVKKNRKKGDVVLVMSNGSFGGLIGMLSQL